MSHSFIFLPFLGVIMVERDYQKGLVKRLKSLYPEAYVFKNNAKQGYPDLVILNGPKWATLEVKKNARAVHQPNQDIHVERMNNMSFSSFIFPENEKEVLHELAVFIGEHE